MVPDPAVWTRIRNMIDVEKADQALVRQRATVSARPSAVPSRTAGGWFRSLPLWRGAAAAGALATVFAIVVGINLRNELLNAPAVQYVAVLSDDKSTASMLVTFDAGKRQLTLQRVGAYSEGQDKSLQLWALPPAAPRRVRWACSTTRLRCGWRLPNPTCAPYRRWRSAWNPRAACRASADRPVRCCSRVP